MASPNDEIRTLLNSSGFLLQLALEASLPSQSNGRDWSSIREHPWAHEDQSGFVDLIAGYGRVRFVIECKRPRGGVWVFPTSPGSTPNQYRATTYWIDYHPQGKDLSGFGDVAQNPASHEADMCIIRGQGDDHKPLLERLASALLLATQSVALQEFGSIRNGQLPDFQIYMPMIVTTAQLFTCEIDPSQIDLDSGELDNVSPKEVPYLRFRKNLSMLDGIVSSRQTLEEASKQNQRSIFVVNSNHFTEFLSDWGEQKTMWQHQRPWDLARSAERRSP